jgi:hypothetical protein
MEAAQTFIEKFNQGVRAIVLLVLTGAFVWGFVMVNKVSGEVFTTIFASVLGYWFASREAKARYEQGPTTTTRTPDTTVTTGPTSPSRG